MGYVVVKEDAQLEAFASAVWRCDFTYRFRLDDAAQCRPFQEAEAEVALLGEGLALGECLAIVEARVRAVVGTGRASDVDAILLQWRKLLIVAGAR